MHTALSTLILGRYGKYIETIANTTQKSLLTAEHGHFMIHS